MATIFLTKTDKTDLPKRHANDKYITEKSLIRAALYAFAPAYAGRILDIGAGDGRWGALAKEQTVMDTSPDPIVVGVEIEDVSCPSGFNYWYPNQDFLTWNPKEDYDTEVPWYYDLIVANPPYNITEKIIRHAWTMLASFGTMIMLLPLDFMTGVDRYKNLWYEFPPVHVGILSRRPTFYGGGTSGTNYAIYVWASKKDRTSAGTPRRWETSLLYYDREKEE